MKLEIIFFLLFSFTTPCKLKSNWRHADIPESIEKSGAVIMGTVVREPSNNYFPNHIRLENAQYYKGCGPSIVQIDGYSSSARCGVDCPDNGTKVIVYVCKRTSEAEDKKSGIVHWRLNHITSFAGQSSAIQKNIQVVESILGKPKTCEDNKVSYSQCIRRKESENFISAESNVGF